jgi:hypothetical protein
MANLKPPIKVSAPPTNVMTPLQRPGGRTVHVPAATVIPAGAEGEKILSAHVGLPQPLGKITAAAHLRKRALPQPGAHAALVKRLFGG